MAEVAARFTLDSLPGKQMAEASYNSGITEEEAARQKNELQRKRISMVQWTVHPNCIGQRKVGILITIVNIVGGP